MTLSCWLSLVPSPNPQFGLFVLARGTRLHRHTDVLPGQIGTVTEISAVATDFRYRQAEPACGDPGQNKLSHPRPSGSMAWRSLSTAFRVAATSPSHRGSHCLAMSAVAVGRRTGVLIRRGWTRASPIMVRRLPGLALTAVVAVGFRLGRPQDGRPPVIWDSISPKMFCKGPAYVADPAREPLAKLVAITCRSVSRFQGPVPETDGGHQVRWAPIPGGSKPAGPRGRPPSKGPGYSEYPSPLSQPAKPVKDLPSEHNPDRKRTASGHALTDDRTAVAHPLEQSGLHIQERDHKPPADSIHLAAEAIPAIALAARVLRSLRDWPQDPLVRASPGC